MMATVRRWLSDLLNLFFPAEEQGALRSWVDIAIGLGGVAFICVMLAAS